MVQGVNSTNLYKDFSSFDYSSKKNYLAALYPKQQVQYYNDSADLKRKKNKKYALSAFLTLSTLAITSAALIGTKKIDVSKFSSEMNEKLKELHLGKKISNLLSNFTNIKDDLWDRVSKKTKGTPLGFIEEGGQKMTEIYRKIVHKASKRPYEQAYQKVIQAGGEGLGIEKFDDWFTKTSNEILETIHKKDNRITDNLFNKNIIKTVTESNIADTKLAEIIQSSSKKIEIPENASKELAQAIEEFNEIKLKTASTVLAKLRDINAGSAPTDVITVILLPLATLGVAVNCAKDKEEKKSIMINLGIPLLTAMASTTFATIKCLSGAKAMIFGLALGQIASLSARTVDKFINNKKENNI